MSGIIYRTGKDLYITNGKETCQLTPHTQVALLLYDRQSSSFSRYDTEVMWDYGYCYFEGMKHKPIIGLFGMITEYD